MTAALRGLWRALCVLACVWRGAFTLWRHQGRWTNEQRAWAVQHWAQAMLRAMGVQCRVQGQAHDGPVMWVANQLPYELDTTHGGMVRIKVGGRVLTFRNIRYTVPSAPTLGTITPGDAELSVAFTLGGSGGSVVTNVEYSTDDGSSWTTPSPASTTSPIVVTGLTNGTTYQVKVRAVNAAGSGAASSATASCQAP
mgnify:CR=1 FL=1